MPVSSKLEGKRLFNPSGIASAYVSMPGSSFSSVERHAAARVVLRHNQHLESHGATKTDGGLHHMYMQLHGMGSGDGEELQENKALLNASQADLFDTVSFMLDHSFVGGH
jgi:hypothetical protein